MLSLDIQLNSLEKTLEVGQIIGTSIDADSVILLFGEMGTGKTTLTKSICQGLGVAPEIVISPTYTIVNIYPGRWTIHHVDLYRLEQTSDLENFDREDLISDGGITLVEWPEILLPILSDEPQLEIQLTAIGETQRLLKLNTSSMKFNSLFSALKKEL